MSKEEISQLRENIYNLKTGIYFVSFLAFIFCLLFVVVLDDNKDLMEQVDSALDLSRSYENSYEDCLNESLPEGESPFIWVVSDNVTIDFPDNFKTQSGHNMIKISSRYYCWYGFNVSYSEETKEDCSYFSENSPKATGEKK
jgi:hypothetical protein